MTGVNDGLRGWRALDFGLGGILVRAGVYVLLAGPFNDNPTKREGALEFGRVCAAEGENGSVEAESGLGSSAEATGGDCA